MVTRTRTPSIVTLGSLMVLLVLPSISNAAKINQDDIIAAVETWVRHVTADAKPDAVVESLEPHVVDGQTVAYIAHLQGGGYCICGADRRLLPVYLYRPIGTYDPTNPGYIYILNDIARRLSLHNASSQPGFAGDAVDESVLADRADYWTQLSAGKVTISTSLQALAGAPSTMTLPVNSAWHQGSPYNDQCPVADISSDEHAVVGCVATAGSQIMYYWQWPLTGYGSDSTTYHYRYRGEWLYQSLTVDPQLALSAFWTNRLYWTTSSGGRLYMSGFWDDTVYESAQKKCNNGIDCNDPDYLAALATLWTNMYTATKACSANFGATTYDWSLMQNMHTDPPDTGDAEVAKLCYHVGIAVHMQYGIFGSEAFTSFMPNVYANHFRYDPDVTYVGRSQATMMDEIQWYRPVQIRGQEEGGHSWVVCGYNTAPDPDQFLMNLGWGGGSTDWLSVDEIYPNDQGTTIRIAPLDVVRFVGGVSGGDGSPAEPYWTLAAAVADAPDEATLIFKAGSEHVQTAPYTISKPVTLKGYNATIRAQ